MSSKSTSNGIESSGFFDRFAAAAADQTGRAWFFAAAVLLVIIWAPSFPLWGNGDTWQLVINTTTTIVTFLLVALLQNSQARSTAAIQHKLDALLASQAEVLDNTDGLDESGETAGELRRMAGVEMEASGQGG
jgi:low affinity Fe/Cu permease